MWFGVLGGLVVRDRAGVVVGVPEVKVRTLLAVLLAHEGRGVSVDRLVEDLWGPRPPGHPANSLQAKISQLRRALGRERVLRQGAAYRLVLDDAEVDADTFTSLVERGRSERDPGERMEILGRALGLWRGAPFADFADAEFVRAPVRLLDELRLGAQEARAEARLELGQYEAAVGELAGLVERHPLRERPRALQLRALYRAGRQSEALDSYERLRRLLADELGVDPSPELAGLHAAILRQDDSLLGAGPQGGEPRAAAGPHTAEPTASADVTPAPAAAEHGLPAPTTALVGRDADLRSIGRLLGGTRLVTLTGPGGVGKTRLAVAAARQAPGMADGARLVEFAGLRGDVDDLAQGVAAALGLRDDAPGGGPGGGPAERLARALRTRHVLLVLDNCEHVVDAAAELAATLLHGAPHVRILATSQEPLGLAADGETVHLVEPLRPKDAAALFTARATASGAVVTADDGAAVAEICRRLDGIPLALELAATRVRALGARELADRIDDRFRLLGPGRRGGPARQRTLRAMIDWSWELLGAPERIVLRRLAVHRDGCTLEAAEAVCAGDGVERADVPDLLARLVDRSLVAALPGPRYRLLESVSAYALERLAEMADTDAVRERHLRHYLGLAERAAPRLRDGGQHVWLGRLDAEAGNLRAALDEAARRDPAAAARLVAALAWWWLLRGRLAEAYRVLAGLPDVPDSGELPLLRAAFGLLTGAVTPAGAGLEAVPDSGAQPGVPYATRWLCAYGLFNGGDPDACGRYLDAHPPHPDDTWGTAAALALRALHALIRGDLAALERDGLRSAALMRRLGDRWGEVQTVQPLAALAEIRGAYEEAERLGAQGLRIAREFGLAAEVCARLSGLGRLALLRQDWEHARDLHERARRQAVEQGYRYGEIHAVMGLALGARRSGDLAAAERHLVRLRDDHGDLSSPAGDHLLSAEFGFLAELRGDARGAAAHHLRGLDAARVLAEPRAHALSLEGLAGALALRGAARDAALLLGAADAARKSVGAPLPPAERGDVERVATGVRAVLGADGYAESFREGAGLLPEEAAVRAGFGARPSP